MTLVYLLGAIVLVMLAIAITMVKKQWSKYAGYIAMIGPILASVYFILQLPKVIAGHYLTVKLPWMASLDINLDLRLDGLSIMFALIISLIGIAVFYYATQYLSVSTDDLPRFFIYLTLFMFSMLGIVLANNTILMYVFWELTSVSSFLLISYWYDNGDSQFGAIQSFMITVFGGLALLVGFIMLYIMTGTNTITEILSRADDIQDQPLFIPMIIMFLLGAFTKSAQFPFHTWLPKAMAAPTPVSAYLHSATMVKAGIFLLFRFTPLLGLSNFYIYTVTFVGLCTMLFGSITALRNYDLKGILAYSTISQLGMIMTMVGLGSGFAQHTNDASSSIYVLILFAGLFHLMNHAIFKCALFMGVGILDHETGSRDIRKLNGMRYLFPKMNIVMSIAALSMAGVPFLNGFLSKEMFLDGLVKSINLEQFDLTLTIIIVAIGVIASIFTFTYAIYMLKETFWGKFDKTKLPRKNIHEPWLFSIPSIILIVLIPIIFVIPNLFSSSLIKPALRNVTGIGKQVDQFAPHISQWHGFNLPLIFTLLIIVVGLFLACTIDWKTIVTGKIRSISLSKGYEKVYRHFEIYSTQSIKRLMQDRLNQYIIATLVVFMMVIMYGYIRIGFPKVHQLHVSQFGPLEIILAIVTVVIGISLVFIRQRLTMVILNGIIGFVVTLFFIAMKAPDLALTQLVVETITTILFIVGFSRLPNVPRSKANIKKESIKIGVALVMAISVVSLIFVAQQADGMASISTFYQQAYELTGGKNIVNAILGDFRALDTLFEGLVLIIAGLGIYTLLNYKDRRGQDERE
ncbi:Na+/H+ antiporter Mnh2 subunit A [Staphylococcus simiae]|uniref:Putative monovalent cation/H+ antiporter subunit A n=1 Tax=Staphylococcus simiae CCM 7213 = CCUG 51256 TaxID=911238 RepID=G5JM76_9STAP|nr:Na+/H+ antiporter Mnh2 subunit A [Staphylococcus simiae]EHJ06723.1 putative monovalent cation/H+ antiporter subunit A [Staphylococcus simiae CCM 7213 = CCUG 51256]PNZ09224.1 monovalent cation/H+ antiporter subunit A [Staphylococcus simiae]SNV63005.1 Putative antiporter subunit mnhA2 [Staphylococcus simiae]